jgi:hypothetical protein
MKKRIEDNERMKITLSGIEHMFAQGLQKVSTIEKHEKNIEVAENGGNMTIAFYLNT